MSERIVFLDANTIGPGVTIGRPTFEHEWQAYNQTSQKEVVSRLSGVSIAISNKVVITAEMLDQLPDLKLIAIAATGYNIVDLDECKQRDIAVCNIRGYAVNTVPEHTFSLILALRRNLIEYREQVLEGEWVRANQFCFFNRPIRDLAGSNLGIIGAGALGQSVGRIALAFGMNVLYLNEHIRTPPDHGRLVSLEELQQQSDVLTLHCPLTEATHNLVDADFLLGMKSSALLINTGRGGLVDETALANAIKAGHIAGAGIDVTECEPAAMDSKIMQIAALPNVIVTPHVAWASVNGMQTLVDQLISNIEAFINDRPNNLLT